jgi:hypothetical protein
MNQTKQPSKEHIRQWLRDRQLNPGPLPTMEQIKSELGWTSGRSREVFKEAVATKNVLTIKALTRSLPRYV